MYFLYRTLTLLATPFVPALLARRRAEGKEDAGRFEERLGRASRMRPEGRLVWIHGASIGEAAAALPLIETLLKANPSASVLLTTVTVTSSQVMKDRLPSRAIHQFVPVDTPRAVESFLAHWKPDVALWVDSELWPNLIVETQRARIAMGMVNARMSEKSFRRWRRAPGLIRRILSAFSFCFAQSEEDADRLRALGIREVTAIGNLKYDAPPLPYDERELANLKALVQGRPLWLAASTHPGEERQIAEVHRGLRALLPEALTIIVPRHSARGGDIATGLSPLTVARRSRAEPVNAATDIYLADTMGELGLFYRLCPVAFIGGSLVAHGGQNPLEAAHLECAVILGPHMENFGAIAHAMAQEGAALTIREASELVPMLYSLLAVDSTAWMQVARAARAHVEERAGIQQEIMNTLQPYLS